jgi:hypothetical protein
MPKEFGLKGQLGTAATYTNLINANKSVKIRNGYTVNAGESVVATAE